MGILAQRRRGRPLYFYIWAFSHVMLNKYKNIKGPNGYGFSLSPFRDGGPERLSPKSLALRSGMRSTMGINWIKRTSWSRKSGLICFLLDNLWQ